MAKGVRLGSFLHKLALILWAATMTPDWYSLEESNFCSAHIGEGAAEVGGVGSHRSRGASRSWHRSVWVSLTDESVELDESLSESCGVEKVIKEKEL